MTSQPSSRSLGNSVATECEERATVVVWLCVQTAIVVVGRTEVCWWLLTIFVDAFCQAPLVILLYDSRLLFDGTLWCGTGVYEYEAALFALTIVALVARLRGLQTVSTGGFWGVVGIEGSVGEGAMAAGWA